MTEIPRLIEGGLAVDDRGQVSYINDLQDFMPYRFYIVENHQQGFVRAWHGHEREAKLVYVLQGAVLIKLMPLETTLSREALEEIQNYVLSAARPAALYIPPGYYNGFKTLTVDTKVMFFSSQTLEESKGDDIRIDANFPIPEIWNIEQR